MQYYFRVLDDGEAIVRCVSLNENGSEIAFSDHSSEHESLEDGDCAMVAPDWSDHQAWTKCDRIKADSLLTFELPCDQDMEQCEAIVPGAQCRGESGHSGDHDFTPRKLTKEVR